VFPALFNLDGTFDLLLPCPLHFFLLLSKLSLKVGVSHDVLLRILVYCEVRVISHAKSTITDFLFSKFDSLWHLLIQLLINLALAVLIVIKEGFVGSQLVV
jgi:hypothetical protein